MQASSIVRFVACAMLAATACTNERVFVAEIVRGYDNQIEENSFEVDSLPTRCRSIGTKVDDPTGRVDAMGEPIQIPLELTAGTFAHFAEFKFRNRFARNRFTEDTSIEPVDEDPEGSGGETTEAGSKDTFAENTPTGEPGTEYIREYTVTYFAEQGGPRLDQQTVRGLAVALPPETAVNVKAIVVVDLALKSLYNQRAADNVSSPQRYSAAYLFKGDDGLEVEASLTFHIGDYNNCADLGPDFYPI